MSRRKHRQQTNSATFIVAKHNPAIVVNNPSNTENTLIDKRDVIHSLVAGAFCIALLFALSEIIHRTDWLAPVTNYFNNLI